MLQTEGGAGVRERLGCAVLPWRRHDRQTIVGESVQQVLACRGKVGGQGIAGRVEKKSVTRYRNLRDTTVVVTPSLCAGRGDGS